MKHLSPPRVVYIAFALVILLGGFLLHLPMSSATDLPIPFLDALFTSTSAICVTGLTVIDPGTAFSFTGQIILLILIQVGGLGIMTVSGFLFALMGRNFGLRGRMVLIREREDEADIAGGLTGLLKKIIVLTVTIELIGFCIMFFQLGGLRSETPVDTAFFSIFHTISAFCNAGFSLMPDSVIQFRDNWNFNLLMITLIILGGVGYPVLISLTRALLAPFRSQKRKKRLDLHTKTVLWTSFWVILIGIIGVLFMDLSHAFASLSIPDKILTSVFQAVSARTAGFSTIETGALSQATLFFICIIMFIGGSPASTGGGIKTTSLAVISSALRSTFLGREEVSLFKRNIPQRLVRQAFVILTFSGAWVLMLTLVLSLTDPGHRLIDLLFEATSAYATVGLSTGITAELSTAGRLFIMFTMLVGRLSAVTLLMTMTIRRNVPNYRYPDEKILL